MPYTVIGERYRDGLKAHLLLAMFIAQERPLPFYRSREVSSVYKCDESLSILEILEAAENHVENTLAPHDVIRLIDMVSVLHTAAGYRYSIALAYLEGNISKVDSCSSTLYDINKSLSSGSAMLSYAIPSMGKALSSVHTRCKETFTRPLNYLLLEE